MTKQTIGIGSVANDGTGDAIRTAFTKVNENFNELYAIGFKNTYTAQAGNSFTAVKVGRLDSDGKASIADASASASASGQLIMATDTIAADAAGEFLEYGTITTSGLTTGSTYYLSEVAGEITLTPPSDPGTVIRVVGYAQSTTRFKFCPDNTILEN